jgi:hypothetical protein
MAPAGDAGPEAAVVSDLEEEALRLAVGDDVLVEAQLAAGADDAVKLGECVVLVGDRAEDEAGDGSVDARVLERQPVGGATDDSDWDGGAGGGTRGLGAESRLGLDCDHLGYGIGVVREVQAMPGTELEHAAGESFK